MRDRARSQKDPDNWYKNRQDMREGESPWVQAQATRAVIKDYSLKHKVTMEWDFNEDSQKERIFRLTVGDNSVVLDWEELLRNGRFI